MEKSHTNELELKLAQFNPIGPSGPGSGSSGLHVKKMSPQDLSLDPQDLNLGPQDLNLSPQDPKFKSPTKVKRR